MEYKTEDENGDSAWYKLVGDRNIPVKVSITAMLVTLGAISKSIFRISTVRGKFKVLLRREEG